MATLIKRVDRHSCLEEIGAEPAFSGLYLGSIVQCSCGRQYVMSDSQREGFYWASLSHEIYHQ